MNPLGSAAHVDSYVGDGVAGRFLGLVSFTPVFAWVTEVNELIPRSAILKLPGMGVNAHETASDLRLPNMITSFQAGGLAIGNNVGVNELGISYDVLMLGEASGFIKLLSYVGNGVLDRSISGAGFTPEIVFVTQVSASNAVIARSPSNTGNDSQNLKNGNLSTSYIRSITADGFTVGTSSNVNGSGFLYEALCIRGFNSEAGKIKFLSWVGNGVEDRQITGAGFRPKFVLTFKMLSGERCYLTQGMAQTFSKEVDNTSKNPDALTGIFPDGFRFGVSSDTNGLGVTYDALCVG